MSDLFYPNVVSGNKCNTTILRLIHTDYGILSPVVLPYQWGCYLRPCLPSSLPPESASFQDTTYPTSSASSGGILCSSDYTIFPPAATRAKQVRFQLPRVNVHSDGHSVRAVDHY